MLGEHLLTLLLLWSESLFLTHSMDMPNASMVKVLSLHFCIWLSIDQEDENENPYIETPRTPGQSLMNRTQQANIL